jgi:uncharacterized RDD family membrane protein YckC
MPYTRPEGLLGHYAGFASRFLALIIDAAIISLIIGALALVTSAIQSLVELTTLIRSISESPFMSTLLQILTSPAPMVASALSLAFFVIYHVFFLTTAGRTPGKAFMGLRVLTIDGRRLSVRRALLRLAGYLLSALPLYTGFLWVLADDRRQAWHDKLARTYVVYTWPARPDEWFLMREIKRLAARRQKRQNSS